ncbi:MAG: germination protein YpeB, partial [Acetobacter sp.]|nr:germination protein YpeB [Acetobacter sp.]
MKKNRDVLADGDLSNYYMKKKETSEDKTEKKIKKTKNTNKRQKRAIIGLSIATGILGLTTLGFGIAYSVTQSQSNELGTRLENVYQKNFFDLVDSVNNTEIKLSKVLNSSTPTYQKKLLNEISQNATAAEVSIAALPLEQSDINDNVRMVNQISGYTSTLADKLSNGGTITSSEQDTLQDIYNNVYTMKVQLNNFARKMQESNYNILQHSLKLDTNDSNFSTQMNHLHDINTEYPTMIYDGPFSDSVTNAQVKGLNGKRVNKEEAHKIVNERFKNVISLDADSETNGRFETFNFRLKNTDEEML